MFAENWSSTGIISLFHLLKKLWQFLMMLLRGNRRGFLRTVMFADVVVFDPQTIADRATFEDRTSIRSG